MIYQWKLEENQFIGPKDIRLIYDFDLENKVKVTKD